jgi:NAD(P)H-hydrate epimerase
MKVLTATQLAQLDAYTIEHEPISSLDLMERAAHALTEAITGISKTDSSFVVFAGPGNNGGDALAVARLLSARFGNVKAYLFNIGGHLSPECEKNRDRLLNEPSSVEFHEITSQFDLPSLSEQDIVVDGLFGIGLNKPVTGGFAMLIKFINRSQATVVSIDVPSGLMCEDNTSNYRAHIIRADYTFTLQAIKPSFLMADNQEFLGKWQVLDIGLLEHDCPISVQYHTSDLSTIKPLLRSRDQYGNKGTFGHGLLIAGSYGMAGAAILAARACLRSGIGKLTVHTPKTNNAILQQAIPEAVIHHDEENYFFTTSIRTDSFNAMAIGPGLGEKKDTAIAFIGQLSHAKIPTIIDADGLNILAGHKGWIPQIPKDTILTPHPKEFSRLFGESESAFDMLIKAREEAIRSHLFIILKGHYTAICCSDGDICFNTTGNSGMATAGTGDVLTGILLALLSQGYPQKDACRLGVYIHGLAGDLAAEELGEEGMIASDVIKYIPYAFKKLKE